MDSEPKKPESGSPVSEQLPKKNGVIVVPDGEEGWKEGEIIYKKYNNGTYEEYDVKDGIPQINYRELPDKTEEKYTNGVIRSRKLPNGTMEYYEGGIMNARILPDKTEERIHEGKVVRRFNNEGKEISLETNKTPSDKKESSKLERIATLKQIIAKNEKILADIMQELEVVEQRIASARINR